MLCTAASSMRNANGQDRHNPVTAMAQNARPPAAHRMLPPYRCRSLPKRVFTAPFDWNIVVHAMMLAKAGMAYGRMNNARNTLLLRFPSESSVAPAIPKTHERRSTNAVYARVTRNDTSRDALMSPPLNAI